MRLAVLVAALMATVPAVSAAANDPAHEARLHYDRGMAHYELGEFRAAVDEFKQAYALSQAPGLLFNLAQASRLGKDYEQALHFYRTYLRVRPDAPNRDDVEKRIVELEPIVEAHRKAEVARLAAGPPPSAPQPATTPETPRTSDVRPRPVPRGGKSERVAGLVVGAIGLGALGAGIGVGLAARSAQNRLNDLTKSMGTWSAADTALYNTGKREAAAATAMYVVGGAAVATGIILYAVGVRRDRARFAVAPAPGGGAQAVWSCDF